MNKDQDTPFCFAQLILRTLFLSLVHEALVDENLEYLTERIKLKHKTVANKGV
jgi:hypothetical protein